MKIKALGKTYAMRETPLTLGEQRQLHREFGWAPGSADLDFQNPDHVAALTYLALQQENPDAPHGMILAMVNRIRALEFVDDDGNPFADDEEEEGQPGETDPTPPTAETAEEETPSGE